ncbi:hypothetical protein [Microbulbifer hainanensis]|uniref:hypothetical protein n=1 Tax=Microbulbifer hainanensis TaxID=2735675 RepID=UPI001868D7AA|nr:hypothetical protein [Microbulbifer hainanensis]
MRNFSKNVRKFIDPFMSGKGFIYSSGYYKNEQSNGVRLMIAFDNGGIDKNSFNIMLLVNSVELDDDRGAYCNCYFTGGSLSPLAKKIPCHNVRFLEGQLQRFIDQYDEVIAPYFSSFKDCSDIADKLSDDSALSSYAADLYFHSGNKRKAKKSYKAWIEHLLTITYIDNDKVEDAILKTKAKIKRCGVFNRA